MHDAVLRVRATVARIRTNRFCRKTSRGARDVDAYICTYLLTCTCKLQRYLSIYIQVGNRPFFVSGASGDAAGGGGWSPRRLTKECRARSLSAASPMTCRSAHVPDCNRLIIRTDTTTIFRSVNPICIAKIPMHLKTSHHHRNTVNQWVVTKPTRKKKQPMSRISNETTKKPVYTDGRREGNKKH
jgi:hypothetical protein